MNIQNLIVNHESQTIKSNSAMDQSKCSLYEHFCLRQEALSISFDAMFWSKILL